VLLPGRRGDLERLRPRFPSGEALATELARRGWLTPLQARWLARGHGRRLVVGQYTLLDRAGQGGMGDVFLAVHRRLGRRAALKVVRPDRAALPGFRERFLREVRALGRLDHENVVHAYDAGAWGRGWYLAMEYVPGPDLRQLLSDGPLPPGRACEYARQAALGLGHLHDRGLVHRDVKPANLSLASGGRRVKVLDAGLVREREGQDDGLTRAGVLVGTPDYAAPEQVADSRRAGRRADQYALGCTLYHLLTGRVPFPDGNPVARAVARLRGTPRPAGDLRPGLPAGLVAAVGRLLARRPQDRFPDMGAAAEALAPFAVPESAGPGDTALTLPTLREVTPLADRA
jgi:serine/threonine-protein kinase